MDKELKEIEKRYKEKQRQKQEIINLSHEIQFLKTLSKILTVFVIAFCISYVIWLIVR